MNVRDFAQMVQDWRQRRAAARDLSQMSDRELADLGIYRADIEIVSRVGRRA